MKTKLALTILVAFTCQANTCRTTPVPPGTRIEGVSIVGTKTEANVYAGSVLLDPEEEVEIQK